MNSRTIAAECGAVAQPAVSAALPGQSGAITVPHLGYRPALDGIRGVAILFVLALNSFLSFFPGGFIGVDIFFVLSGFLITTLLLEEWERSGTISLKLFYLRRALRLLPALLGLLLASCVYAALFQPAATARVTYEQSAWVLLYFANWMLTWLHAAGSLDHAWSLSVEEQFYIIWPLLLWLLLRSGLSRKAVIGLVLALAAAASVWRSYLWGEGAHYLRLYYGTDTRADALLIGCVAGLLFAWALLPRTDGARRVIRVMAIVAAGGLLLVGLTVSDDAVFMYRGGFTLVALAAAALIVHAVWNKSGIMASALAWPALVWIGRISYSLYLWHYPVFHVLRVERFDGLGWPFAFVHLVRFAAVFAAACASFYLIEQPFLRLKKRFGTES